MLRTGNAGSDALICAGFGISRFFFSAKNLENSGVLAKKKKKKGNEYFYLYWARDLFKLGFSKMGFLFAKKMGLLFKCTFFRRKKKNHIYIPYVPLQLARYISAPDVRYSGKSKNYELILFVVGNESIEVERPDYKGKRSEVKRGKYKVNTIGPTVRPNTIVVVSRICGHYF